MSDTNRAHPVFEPILAEVSEQHRDELLAAFAAVENSSHPVPEVQLLALRDATLRRNLQRLLHRVGRTLVAVGGTHWTSGYRDDVAAELTVSGWNALPVIDRAVLVLVLIHSVAIPRSQGVLGGDSWTSAQPTPADELLRYAQIQKGDVRAALQRLRARGLVQPAPTRGRGAGNGPAYLPGPQLHRLTPPARRALQEELILAAAPDSPLAAAIRARRAHPRGEQ
ncbi:hypothetical protein ALI22I_07675 [Saccharothrix sp. ALI-22-I]|uniref:hypothetical protein n=1 Tax=Saccharothrix sp. ALI-22-I TaxID=1933778 RepID=UPI00097CB6F9|nr:hypothetical protein [Saccharothrix sp. ALI-22-I]ONI91737.1 hypothetical protein ALI22I_07675 [Saccharothrix sp. ALI-22-I]